MTETVNCDQCGEEIKKIPSKVSEYNFCSRECFYEWESDKKTIHCDNCGNELERSPSQISKNNFCDRKCKGEWKSENRSGENSPHWKSGKIKINCKQCGDTFKARPSNNRKFCSKECDIEWKSENLNGKDHHSWKGGKEEVECKQCGKEYERQPCKIERSEHHFCSHKCYGEWLSENIYGENHPRWKGGYKPDYGDNWEKQRQKTLERDNYECQKCGISNEEHINKINRELEVHHKIPIRKFDDPKDANYLENLITYCLKCHREEENSYDNNGDIPKKKDTNVKLTAKSKSSG